MKNNRILNNIKYIPYDNSFSLIDFAENYVHTLDEKVFELQTVEGNIEIVFLKRHLPHIIGLHYFVDRKSKNQLLIKKYNLQGQKGFNNIYSGFITLEDLKSSQGGKIWKNKRNKDRVLTMHLIPEIIRNSTLYLIDGNLKGKINAKYILYSRYNKKYYTLCIDEDIKLNRLGKNYCCISNLINDNHIISLIEEDKLKKIEIKRVIKKDYYNSYNNPMLEIIHRKHVISSNNPGVNTIPVSVACVGELLLNDCVFSAVYVESVGMYYITYFSVDISVLRIISKYK